MPPQTKPASESMKSLIASAPPAGHKQPSTKNTDTKAVETLLKEMERLMSLDRILDARKVVDAINIGLSLSGDTIAEGTISKSQQKMMHDIVLESKQVHETLHDLQTDDTWNLCVENKRGITVHYRNEKGSPIHAVKTQTVFDDFTPTNFIELCALFLESDLAPLWFPKGILKTSDVLAHPSKFNKICHMKLRLFPFPMRDVVVDGRGYHLADRNAVLVYSKSIDSSPHCKVPKPEGSVVRMETTTAFYFQLHPGNKLTFKQIEHNDLKFKYIPSFLLNFISQGTVPFDTIENIKKTLASFDGNSVFEKRIQANPHLYKEIENRLNQELAAMQHKSNLTAQGKVQRTTLAQSAPPEPIKHAVRPIVSKGDGKKTLALHRLIACVILLYYFLITSLSLWMTGGIDPTRLPWIPHAACLLVAFVAVWTKASLERQNSLSNKIDNDSLTTESLLPPTSPSTLQSSERSGTSAAAAVAEKAWTQAHSPSINTTKVVKEERVRSSRKKKKSLGHRLKSIPRRLSRRGKSGTHMSAKKSKQS